MKRLLCILLLASGAAAAQPASRPVENVTVTGTRERQVLEKFVEGFTTPNRITGKMARWNDGVCPITVGLAPKFAAFITQRLRDVAREAGAPVSANPACKPNIEIAFTTAPQALVNRLREKNSLYLGYHDNEAQLDRLATVTRPIQAWYTTATEDLHGNVEIDSGQTKGPG